MHVLVVGGSGLVGGLVLPHLAQWHTLRVFDLRPPSDPGWEHVAGGVDDIEALERAAAGTEALLYMAMGDKRFDTNIGITTNFDVNVKGVYLALCAAQRAGVAHAVYTSSMSVYGSDLMTRYFPDEDLTPDASDIYGLTKRMGEEVCRNATRAWGMSVTQVAVHVCHSCSPFSPCSRPPPGLRSQSSLFAGLRYSPDTGDPPALECCIANHDFTRGCDQVT
jgi:nucleoside-diphosphate-sugar epimerase